MMSRLPDVLALFVAAAQILFMARKNQKFVAKQKRAERFAARVKHEASLIGAYEPRWIKSYSTLQNKSWDAWHAALRQQTSKSSNRGEIQRPFHN